VSKLHLDVCVAGTQQRVPNDADGWTELTAMLQAVNVDLVVLEATGGYERGLVCALQGAGLCVARVNPRQARDFAKSLGVLAKTDQADARVLRDFANVLACHADRLKFIAPMIEQARQVLAELMTRRRQLVDMRVAESNRLTPLEGLPPEVNGRIQFFPNLPHQHSIERVKGARGAAQRILDAARHPARWCRPSPAA
jgi:transposase